MAEDDIMNVLVGMFEARNLKGEDGVTGSEVAASLGVSTHKATSLMRDLINQGTLRPVLVYRNDAWGLRRRQRGYALSNTKG